MDAVAAHRVDLTKNSSTGGESLRGPKAGIKGIEGKTHNMNSYSAELFEARMVVMKFWYAHQICDYRKRELCMKMLSAGSDLSSPANGAIILRLRVIILNGGVLLRCNVYVYVGID